MPRDYKVEYRRRIERAAALGFTRSQARGHARAGESQISPGALDHTPIQPLEAALKRMRGGSTLAAAATEAHLSRERLSAYIKTRAGAARSGRAWTFNDQRRRTIEMFAAGQDRPLVVDVIGYEPARLAGQHWDEAYKALADADLHAAFVRRWDSVTIRDATGVRRTLSTNLDELYRAAFATEQPFEEIYRLVG